MKYISLPGSSLPLSPIALGCDADPLRFSENGSGEKLLEDTYKLGITVFDTARGYGKSETCIGNWLKSHPEVREHIYIISKGCLPFPFSRLKPSCLRKDMEKSHKELGTYIDMYLLHRDDKRADLKEIFSILNEYREKGYIREYGVSNWTIERIEEAQGICKENGFAPITLSSVNLSAAPWEKDPWGGGDGCVSISDDEKSQDYYKEKNMPVLAFSPLARGFLSGKVKSGDKSTYKRPDAASRRAYLNDKNLKILKVMENIALRRNVSVPVVSLAYIMSLGMKVIPSIGVHSASTMEKNIKALDFTLTDEDMNELRNVINGR